MSGALLLVLLVVPMVGALALGVWIGLGYPGLHDRPDGPEGGRVRLDPGGERPRGAPERSGRSGRRRRRTPFEILVDRVVGFFDG